MSDLSAFDLTGKTVLVTGANTGIGQGIAVAIARAGGHVLAASRSSMAETEAQVRGLPGRLTPLVLDLADPQAAVVAIEAILGERGPVHGLVNNAGIIRRADTIEHSEADWDEVLAVNLKSVFLLSQAFARSAIAGRRPGKIVNIASLLSFQGGIRVAAYTASKHGIAGLTKVMANEWAAEAINVNAIAPGYIVSNNTEALRADPDRSASILARIPAGRWGRPSDIGDAAVFLLSRASDYMQGAIIPVDGGWLAR